MIRPLPLLLVTLWATAVEPNVEPVTKIDVIAPAVLLEQAIQAGFPDVRGAVLWRGDWLDARRPDERQWSGEGLHLRLADGRWLVAGRYLRPAQPVEAVLAPGAAPQDPAQVGALRPTPALPVPPPPAVDALLQARFPDLGVPGQDLRRPLMAQMLTLATHAADAAVRDGCLAAAQALMTPEERSAWEVGLGNLARLQPWAPAYDLALAERLERWDAQDGSRAPARFPDIPELIALLDDGRPARIIDRAHFRARTIGEQAEEALSRLWAFPPRRLAGLTTDEDLAPEQRARVVEATRRVWEAGGRTTILDGLLASPDQRSLVWTTPMATAIEKKDRPRAAVAIAAGWKALDPEARKAIDPRLFNDLVALLGNEAVLDTEIRSWPVEGPLTCSLAVWHEYRENPAPLTAHLRQVLARVATGDMPGRLDPDVILLTRVTLLHPTQERLDLLLTALREPTDGPVVTFLLSALKAARVGLDVRSASSLWNVCVPFRSGSEAMVLAVVAQELSDLREIGDGNPKTTLAMTLASQHSDLLRGAIPPDAGSYLGEEQRYLDAIRANLAQTLPQQLAVAGLRLPDVAAPSFPAWWQAELDAAKAESKSVLLVFTNTDVSWHSDRLQKEVLSMPAWQNWAKDRIRLVVFDQSAIPAGDADTREHTQTLERLYSGYFAAHPTLFLIDAQGRQLGSRLAFDTGGPEFYIKTFTARLAPAATAP